MTMLLVAATGLLLTTGYAAAETAQTEDEDLQRGRISKGSEG
jgi:hypothetical protein